jgi:hypothetical protein
MNPMNHKKYHLRGKCSGMLILLVSVITFQGLLTSCAFTWTGYAIGKKIDEQNSSAGVTDRVEQAIPNDKDWIGLTELEIEKIDNTSMTGQFIGYGYQSYNHYQPRYEYLKDSIAPKAQLPNLETNLTVSFKENPPVRTTGLFEGFNREGIILSIDGAQQHISTRDAIRLEDSHGIEYDLNTLNELISSGSTPVRSVLCIKPEHDVEYQVPFDQISYVRYTKSPRSARQTGFIIGGSLDIIITAAIWSAVIISFRQR